MKHLKTYYSETKLPDKSVLVNFETGEQVLPEVKKHKFFTDKKEEFYLMYSHLLNAMQQDMTISEVKVFSYLLQNFGKSDNFSLSKGLKEKMCKKVGISHISTINNALKTLQSKKYPMIYKLDRNLYKVNPRYAFKGSSSNRGKEMVAIFELGCKDC